MRITNVLVAPIMDPRPRFATWLVNSNLICFKKALFSSQCCVSCLTQIWNYRTLNYVTKFVGIPFYKLTSPLHHPHIQIESFAPSLPSTPNPNPSTSLIGSFRCFGTCFHLLLKLPMMFKFKTFNWKKNKTRLQGKMKDVNLQWHTPKLFNGLNHESKAWKQRKNKELGHAP
jgi:hypothetical protein